MTQPTLFNQPADPPECTDFDGDTYDAKHDKVRLGGKLKMVFDLLSDGKPRTKAEMNHELGLDPNAATDARARDLRKKKFGGYNVPSNRRGSPKDGIWEYRLVLEQGGGGKP